MKTPGRCKGRCLGKARSGTGLALLDLMQVGRRKKVLSRRKRRFKEDEGIGMAMGTYLVSKKPVVMMEGSGEMENLTNAIGKNESFA